MGNAMQHTCVPAHATVSRCSCSLSASPNPPLNFLCFPYPSKCRVCPNFCSRLCVISRSPRAIVPHVEAALAQDGRRPMLGIRSSDTGEVAKAFRRESSMLQVDSILDAIKWDEKGLIVAIAQHVNTGSILMQGFANRDAVAATMASGKATFYSRSRSSLWTKGETSSNFINVVDLYLDCDCDSIIYLGEPEGPTCHTGAETCYFTPACGIGKSSQAISKRYATTTLYSLEETIDKRKAGLSTSSKSSWTHKLLKDHNLLCSKIREEADELCRTLLNDEGKNRTASEMADVLYHAMVLLAVQDVKLEDVLKILQARFAQSGIEEKSSRK